MSSHKQLKDELPAPIRRKTVHTNPIEKIHFRLEELSMEEPVPESDGLHMKLVDNNASISISLPCKITRLKTVSERITLSPKLCVESTATTISSSTSPDGYISNIPMSGGESTGSPSNSSNNSNGTSNNSNNSSHNRHNNNKSYNNNQSNSGSGSGFSSGSGSGGSG
eukprot:488086_1